MDKLDLSRWKGEDLFTARSDKGSWTTDFPIPEFQDHAWRSADRYRRWPTPSFTVKITFRKPCLSRIIGQAKPTWKGKELAARSDKEGSWPQLWVYRISMHVAHLRPRGKGVVSYSSSVPCKSLRNQFGSFNFLCRNTPKKRPLKWFLHDRSNQIHSIQYFLHSTQLRSTNKLYRQNSIKIFIS